MRGHRLVSDQDLPIRMRCIPDQLRIRSILSGNALMARLRLCVMSVLWPLSDEKRKWLGHSQTDAIDPRRTPHSARCLGAEIPPYALAVCRFCIAPRPKVDASGPFKQYD